MRSPPALLLREGCPGAEGLPLACKSCCFTSSFPDLKTVWTCLMLRASCGVGWKVAIAYRSAAAGALVGRASARSSGVACR